MNIFSKTIAASLIAISALSFSAAPSFSQAVDDDFGSTGFTPEGEDIEQDFSQQAITNEVTRLQALRLTPEQFRASLLAMADIIVNSANDDTLIETNALLDLVASAANAGASVGQLEALAVKTLSLIDADIGTVQNVASQRAVRRYYGGVLKRLDGILATKVRPEFLTALNAAIVAFSIGQPLPALSASPS